MPQIPFSSQSRAVKVGQVEKLTLGYGEFARVVLLENPIFRYNHTLRAPKIVNGQAVQVTKKRRGKAGEDGDTYETWETDFVGRPFCLGRDEVLAEKGVDPDNCPACRRSTESNQVKAPERRFAVNVVRYHMDKNGRPVTPFSCEVIAWAFNESTFDKLIGIAEEYAASGGLIGRDLRFGPCENKDFQKFAITPGDQAWWSLSEENKQRVIATYQQNKKTEQELESLCGREVSAGLIAEDLGKIADKWRIVDSGGAERPDPTSAVDRGTVTEGLADLLNAPTTSSASGPAPAAPVAEPTLVTPGAAPVEMSDILGAVTPPAITPTGGAPAVGFDILAELDKLNA